MGTRSHEFALDQYLTRELRVNRGVSIEGFVFDALGIEFNFYITGSVADEHYSITAKRLVEVTKLWRWSPFLQAERREFCITGFALAY